MTRLAAYTVPTEREAIARVARLHPEPRLVISERADLRFLAIRYTGAGSVTYPALGFYAVSLRDGAAQLHVEGWRPGHVRAAPHTTFVQATSRVVEYVWARPHAASAMCVDPAEVERAAVETGLLNPSRVELVSRVESDAVASHLIRALSVQESWPPHPGQELVAQALQKAMATHLLTRYGVFAPRHRATALSAIRLTALKRAIAYLEDHLDGPCGLDELAAQAGTSSFEVAALFRRATGLTPAGYLLRARLERAKQQLVGPHADLARIAIRLGFSDAASFRHVFVRAIGVSPERFADLHGSFPGSARRSAERPS